MLPRMHSPAGTFFSFNPPYNRKMEPHLLDLRLPQELEDSYLEKAEFSSTEIIGTFLFTWSLSGKHGQWIPWCFENLLTLALPQPVGISFLTSHLCVPLPDVNHPLKRDRTWRYDPGPCRQKPWLQHGWPCWWHDGIMPQLLWHDFILVFKNMCWSWMT